MFSAYYPFQKLNELNILALEAENGMKLAELQANYTKIKSASKRAD
jgi:hypothetical protein